MSLLSSAPAQTPERIRQEIGDLDYVGHARAGLYATQARRLVEFVAQERGLRANERSRLKDDLIGGIFEPLRQNGEVDIPKNIEPKINGMDLYSMCCCFAPSGSDPSPLLHRLNGATHDLNQEIAPEDLAELDCSLLEMLRIAYEPGYLDKQFDETIQRLSEAFGSDADNLKG